MQFAVAADVRDADAIPRDDPADQQLAMAHGRVFFAAHDGDAKPLDARLESLDAIEKRR